MYIRFDVGVVKVLGTGNRHADGSQSHAEFAKLLVQYRPLVDYMAEKYSAMSDSPDVDFEDLRQEGSIALYSAMISYDRTQKDVTFGLYAKVCIRNRLISVLRKHKKVYDEDPDIFDGDSDPERRFIENENYRAMLKTIDELLTPYQKSVFELYLKNKKYSEIAQELGTNVKSVGNALSRIKKKLKDNI